MNIEVTTLPDIRLRHAGVVQHRRAPLALVDLTRCQGIPITTPARTLVDTATLVRSGRLGSVVDDALCRTLVTLGELRQCHDRIDSGPGRRATVAMRDVLAERTPGYDPGGSDRERTRLLVALGWTMIPITARTSAADLVRDVRASLALCGQARTA